MTESQGIEVIDLSDPTEYTGDTSQSSIKDAQDAFLLESVNYLKLISLKNTVSPKTFLQKSNAHLDFSPYIDKNDRSNAEEIFAEEISNNWNTVENKDNQQIGLDQQNLAHKPNEDNLGLSSDEDPEVTTASHNAQSRFRIPQRFAPQCVQTQNTQVSPLITSMQNQINVLKKRTNTLEKEKAKHLNRANKFIRQASLMSLGIKSYKKRSGGISPKPLRSFEEQLRNTFLVPIIVRKPTKAKPSKIQKPAIDDDFFKDLVADGNTEADIEMPSIGSERWKEIKKAYNHEINTILGLKNGRAIIGNIPPTTTVTTSLSSAPGVEKPITSKFSIHSQILGDNHSASFSKFL